MGCTFVVNVCTIMCVSSVGVMWQKQHKMAVYAHCLPKSTVSAIDGLQSGVTLFECKIMFVSTVGGM
jgi:hydrogenase-4 membrane subunit HyfE